MLVESAWQHLGVMVEVLAIEGSQKFSGIDALPYIDPLTDEDKAKAEEMIDKEMSQMRAEGRTPEQYIAHLPPIDSYLRFKNSPIMQGEMKRIEAGVKMEPLDETRMSIEPPRLHEQNSLEAWNKCVDNASAQLEHQHHRVQNFRLAVKHAPAVWKAHNARTDVYIKMAEARLKEVQAEITKVNQRRKLQQEKAKVNLDRLSKQYNDLVKRNIDMALACKKLELQKEQAAGETDAGAEDKEASAMEH